MRIGGFVKQSLMDYPGKIAAVIFTQGCNFRCGYCHNPQLVLPELFLSNPEFASLNILSYLKERKSWLDGVVVSGGEPTIHKDLPLFLKEIKDMGYSVKLDTNGSNPFILEQIIKENLVDYIAMDIKTVLDSNTYSKLIGISNADFIIENIIASIYLIKQSNLDYEFRTTKIPNEQVVDLMTPYLSDIKRFTFNEFRNGDIVKNYIKCNS
jgi:pyruvate formate lyase activating enzyme